MKRWLRWAILAAVAVFLALTLHARAAEVAKLRLGPGGGGWLGAAAAATAIAHLWSSLVWAALLRSLGCQVGRSWAVRVYLTTNAAKYLPGNVWHFWGRILAVAERGYGWGAAALCALLEPLVMAAAAGLLGLAAPLAIALSLRGAIALGILAALHPRWLNPLITRLGKSKLKDPPALATPTGSSTNLADTPVRPSLKLRRYPARLLAGEVGFVLLRGLGFAAAIAAFAPFEATALPQILGGFSLAWLAGLVVPGAPGGLGVFEASAIALLGHTVAPAALLGAVAAYRLLSVAIEAALAGLAAATQKRVIKL